MENASCGEVSINRPVPPLIPFSVTKDAALALTEPRHRPSKPFQSALTAYSKRLPRPAPNFSAPAKLPNPSAVPSVVKRLPDGDVRLNAMAQARRGLFERQA